MKRVLAITLALFAVLWIAALVRYSPPPARSRDSAKELFSAERAREVQTRLVGDGAATRYVTTPGNAAARALIIGELERVGWKVEPSKTQMSCTYHGLCAPVTNIVAVLAGSDAAALQGSVLISAHYDSVPVGPGASDDGVGTATLLETARALSSDKPRRTIVALFDDGEEAGLLGSDAFVRTHPLAKTIRSTVNVDARGSHGPSQMFETTANNGWLISLVSKHVDRPVTTSLFYEVYKRMPNDTDFTATKTIAAGGVNFANTAGIEHYHTPYDALDVADIGTLQHHGDHVLAMTRALASYDENAQTNVKGDVVWFDVLAFFIVSWPEPWTLPIALLALALVIGHAIRHRVFDRGFAAFFASLLAGLVSALLAGMLLRGIGATPAPWVGHPTSGLLAIHVAGALGAFFVLSLLAPRSNPRALWAGTWIGWGVLGVALAAFTPGMSYVFIVPTFVAAIAGALPFNVACALPAGVAAVLVLALETAIYDALGFVVPPLVGLPIVLMVTTLAPMLADLPKAVTKRVSITAAIVTVLACIVATLVPKFSDAHPQRVNVVYRQDAAAAAAASPDKARVFIDTTWGPATWGAPPLSMMTAAGAAAGKDAALPWTLPTPFAETPPLGSLKAPSIDVVSTSDANGVHKVRAKLMSNRGASTIALFFPVGRHVGVTVDGHSAIPRPVTNGNVVGILGVPAEGISVDLESTGAGPIPLTILDRTFGVPAGTKADDAVHARGKDATPFQDGDVTVLTKTTSL